MRPWLGGGQTQWLGISSLAEGEVESCTGWLGGDPEPTGDETESSRSPVRRVAVERMVPRPPPGQHPELFCPSVAKMHGTWSTSSRNPTAKPPPEPASVFSGHHGTSQHARALPALS